MTWDELVEDVTGAHRELKPGSMFGMPCLKRPDGEAVAGFWKDGGVTPASWRDLVERAVA